MTWGAFLSGILGASLFFVVPRAWCLGMILLHLTREWPMDDDPSREIGAQLARVA